eukprot:scaffold100708_cov37-Tisochrysis_lutea.AAC.2
MTIARISRSAFTTARRQEYNQCGWASRESDSDAPPGRMGGRIEPIQKVHKAGHEPDWLSCVSLPQPGHDIRLPRWLHERGWDGATGVGA